MRGLWGKQKGMFSKRETDKAAYDSWQTEFKTKRGELDALAAKYEDEIYRMNKLQPIKVEIVPSPRPVPVKADKPDVAKKEEAKKAA